MFSKEEKTKGSDLKMFRSFSSVGSNHLGGKKVRQDDYLEKLKCREYEFYIRKK